MKQRIDLHNHTFGSDGKQTILKLMKRAKLRNIKIVAVTDHDSVEGFHYFQHEMCKIVEKIEEKQDTKAANRLLKLLDDVKIIKGAELITSYKGNIVEILAYDYELNKMSEQIEILREGLKTRAELFYEKFCAVIKEKNIIINMENLNKAYKNALEEEKNQKVKIFYHNNKKIKVVNKKRTGVVGPFFKEMIKNEKNCKYLEYEEDGIIKQASTIKEFITKHVYNQNSIFYVDVTNTRPKYEDTIKAIHRAGGMAVLAHPGRYKTEMNIKEEIDSMILYGLDGLEVWYPDHSTEFSKFLLTKVKKYKLIASGGSDDHCVPSEGQRYNLGNCKIQKIKETKWIYEIIKDKRDFVNNDSILKECKRKLENLLEKV